MTGDPISAQRAYELGFVNQVVPKGDALTAAYGRPPCPFCSSSPPLFFWRGGMGLGAAVNRVSTSRSDGRSHKAIFADFDAQHLMSVCPDRYQRLHVFRLKLAERVTVNAPLAVREAKVCSFGGVVFLLFFGWGCLRVGAEVMRRNLVGVDAHRAQRQRCVRWA